MAAVKPEYKIPRCPTCGSANVITRQADNITTCRRCGQQFTINGKPPKKAMSKVKPKTKPKRKKTTRKR